MLNYIWAFLLLTGLIAGALFGRLDTMVDNLWDTCENVVLKIALPLAGIWMLWLGVLRVMEKAGLMEAVSRMLAPLLRRIFPDVPRDHPAMGAMTMNIAANMLGLGNAATPAGLKAMEHLQELNPNKQSASNAMCTFLALNTAGFALIPTGAIAYLSSGGVKSPHAIIAPAIIATLLATITGILAARLFQRLPMFRVQPDTPAASTDEKIGGDKPAAAAFRPSRLRQALISLAALGFVFGTILQFSPESREKVLQTTGMASIRDAAEERKKEAVQRKAEHEMQEAGAAETPEDEKPWWSKAINGVSLIAIPAILLIVILWGLARGVPVYEELVEGAKEGFGVATRVMPFLVIMLAGISLFRDSGALMMLEHFLRPALNLIGMPVELFPLAAMRPLSGSGSVGLLNDIILNPISTDFLRYTAAILFSSTETTFYVLAVYFGSVSIRRTRHALAAGLCADVMGMMMAVVLGRWMFGHLM
jgi:spore maturation protein SpmA